MPIDTMGGVILDVAKVFPFYHAVKASRTMLAGFNRRCIAKCAVFMHLGSGDICNLNFRIQGEDEIGEKIKTHTKTFTQSWCEFFHSIILKSDSLN